MMFWARNAIRHSFVIALLLLPSNRCLGQDYTWSAATGGSWTNGTNWGSTPTDFPNSAGSRATFSSVGNTSAKTVTLDAAITLRRLNFNAEQTGEVTLAPGVGGSLSLTTAGGGQPSLVIEAGSGNHSITANMSLVGPDAHKWVFGTGQTLTVTGNIGGAQGLSLLGPGITLLNGTNNYTGPTLVALGTLGGSGTLASHVTIVAVAAPGATITAGTSAAAPVMTLQNGLALNGRYLVTLFDNNTLSRLNVTGSTASLDSITSSLEIALGSGVTVESFRAAGARSFTIIDAGSNQLSGTFSATNFTNAGFANSEWSVTYDSSTGNATLNFTPVPEPTAILGLASGVALFTGLSRRKRR
jgi:autotransporter-associated beta strand protein